MLLAEPKVLRATAYAARAHAGQVRKYEAIPYISHPFAVASIIAEVPGANVHWVQVALLHDVIEDCGVFSEEIELLFGIEVAEDVIALSIEKNPDKPRVLRKSEYRARVGAGSEAAHNVKAADIIHNGPSIKHYAPDFWIVWSAESRLMLKQLNKANPALLERAWAIVQ